MQTLVESIENNKLTPRNFLTKLKQPEIWEIDYMSDPKYLGAYFRLGIVLDNVSRVLQYGFGKGLIAATIAQTCPSIKQWAGFQNTTNDFWYTFTDGYSNLKEYYKGQIDLRNGGQYEFCKLAKVDRKKQRWDLIIFSDPVRFLEVMDAAWENAASDAWFVVDRLDDESRKAKFLKWCELKNIEPTFYPTTYNLAIARRQ